MWLIDIIKWKVWDAFVVDGVVYEIRKLEENHVQTTCHKWFEYSEMKAIWNKEKNIWGFKCHCEYMNDTLIVKYRHYTYTTTYFWDVDKFIKDNNTTIVNFIKSKLQKEVDDIMKEFTEDFNRTLTKLKPVILKHTKDLLLAQIVKGFSDNIVKVAEQFQDSNIKKTLLTLIKK